MLKEKAAIFRDKLAPGAVLETFAEVIIHNSGSSFINCGQTLAPEPYSLLVDSNYIYVGEINISADGIPEIDPLYVSCLYLSQQIYFGLFSPGAPGVDTINRFIMFDEITLGGNGFGIGTIFFTGYRFLKPVI